MKIQHNIKYNIKYLDAILWHRIKSNMVDIRHFENGFYPRDAYMHSAVFAVERWLERWLDVCHTPVLCLNGQKMAKPILKLSRPSGSPIIPVFLTPPNSKGNSVNWGTKYMGV